MSIRPRAMATPRPPATARAPKITGKNPLIESHSGVRSRSKLNIRFVTSFPLRFFYKHTAEGPEHAHRKSEGPQESSRMRESSKKHVIQKYRYQVERHHRSMSHILAMKSAATAITQIGMGSRNTMSSRVARRSITACHPTP